jgi:M6 family metalloprotease-like protein
MKTLPRFCRVPVWLAGLSALLGGPGAVCAAAPAPTLTDFGYRHLSSVNQVSSNRPLLVVLGHFTDEEFTFRDSVQAPTNCYSQCLTCWSNWVFNPANEPDSIVNYTLEISHQRFSWTLGGIIMVSLDPSWRYTNVGSATLFASNIIHAALVSGQFPFDQYTGTDQEITHRELQLLLIYNDQTIGGKRVGVDVRPNGLAYGYVGNVAILNSDGGPVGAAHELCHTLGAVDLYGIWGQRPASNKGLSLMSTGYEDLDPWHKMQFGWNDPPLCSMRAGGVFTLPAAPLAPANALLLHDPQRGAGEFFLLEYRSPSFGKYERDVSVEGLAIWHVLQANLAPKLYAQIAYPQAEPGWRRCTLCQALVRGEDQCGACPSTNAVSGMHSLHPDNHGLVTNNLAAPGQSGWRQCAKCLGLFYGSQQSQSDCPAGGRHEASNSPNYTLIYDNPEAVGHMYWRRCQKCEALYFGSEENASICPAGGSHASAGGDYTLPCLWAQVTVMNEGPSYLPGSETNFWTGGTNLWTGGATTPYLRWYDGTPTGVKIAVRPFSEGAQSITLEILSEYDTWVDFNYTGTEDGTFPQPWNTFAEGVANVGFTGTVKIKAGVSSETPRVTKPLSVRAYGGPVTIGQQ